MVKGRILSLLSKISLAQNKMIDLSVTPQRTRLSQVRAMTFLMAKRVMIYLKLVRAMIPFVVDLVMIF